MQRLTTIPLLRRLPHPSRQPLFFLSNRHHLHRSLTTTTTTTTTTTRSSSAMSSDEDYAAFLEKANQDTSGGDDTSTPAAKDTTFAQTKAVDTNVPASLKKLDVFYQSETDEPFQPVALQHGKRDSASLDTKTFAKLIGHPGDDVQEVPLKEWNVKNHYADVVDAVGKAGGNNGQEAEVRVFRVSHDHARCEYYVVTLNDDGVVVGVKARAVES